MDRARLSELPPGRSVSGRLSVVEAEETAESLTGPGRTAFQAVQTRQLADSLDLIPPRMSSYVRPGRLSQVRIRSSCPPMSSHVRPGGRYCNGFPPDRRTPGSYPRGRMYCTECSFRRACADLEGSRSRGPLCPRWRRAWRKEAWKTKPPAGDLWRFYRLPTRVPSRLGEAKADLEPRRDSRGIEVLFTRWDLDMVRPRA
jgi:hypothetical protein